MMKNIIIAITLILSNSISSAADEPIENKTETEFNLNGFRELKWGDSLSKYKNSFVLFQKGEGITLYKRKNEKLSIGSAKITNLVYSFQSDQFTGVIFHTEGKDNKTAIIEQLDTKFSKNRRKPSSDDSFVSWINKNVKAGIRCGRTDICQIFYTKK